MLQSAALCTVGTIGSYYNGLISLLVGETVVLSVRYCSRQIASPLAEGLEVDRQGMTANHKICQTIEGQIQRCFSLLPTMFTVVMQHRHRCDRLTVSVSVCVCVCLWAVLTVSQHQYPQAERTPSPHTPNTISHVIHTLTHTHYPTDTLVPV